MGFLYIRIRKMNLLQICKSEFDNRTTLNGYQPSVINLCNEHNLKLAEELKGKDIVFRTTSDEILGNRVHTLFSKPVIEEAYRNKVKCFICEYICRKPVDYYE